MLLVKQELRCNEKLTKKVPEPMWLNTKFNRLFILNNFIPLNFNLWLAVQIVEDGMLGAMANFKEETAECINTKTTELSKTRKHKRK